MRLSGLDKLKLSLYLLSIVDELLVPLEKSGFISDDIRTNIMEVMDEIEELIEE